MDDKREGFWQSTARYFTRRALWELVKAASGLLFAVLIAASSVYGVAQVTRLAPYAWWIAATCIPGVIWAILTLRDRFNRHQPHFPSLDFDFLILEKCIEYDYQSSDCIVYRKRVKLKALKNGLETYPDKYHWTGSGMARIKSNIPEQEVRRTIKKNIWQFTEVRFPVMLNKGQTIESEVEWILDDKNGSAVPFVSATIEEPTALLRIHVKIARSLGVRKVTREISGGIGAKKPFESTEVALDGRGEYTWEVKRPRLLYHYEIKWVPAGRHAEDNYGGSAAGST